MPRKSCRSKRRNKKYSKRCLTKKQSKRRSKKQSKRRSRKYSKKKSRRYSRRRDGMNDNRLLSETIPRDIDMFEYEEMDVEDKPFIIKDEYVDYRDYLEPLLNTPDSDVETIPDEYLTEYKSLKPPEKMKISFNRLYYKCQYCKEPQYSRDNLKDHLKTVHNKPVYICEEPECEYISARKSDFIRHKHKKTNIKKET